MKVMKCELLISNHAYITGIEDYIKAIKGIFEKNNISLSVVTNVNDDVDLLLLIDEFVNPSRKFFDILNHCKNKGIRICLIHTEFMDKNQHYNIFTSKDLIFRKIVFADLLLFFYRNFYFLFCLISVLYIFYGKVFLSFSVKDTKKRIYFAMRDRAFSKVYELFDYHICLSDNIYDSLKSNFSEKNIIYLQHYVEPSVIDSIKDCSNQTLIYMSGYKTKYRQNTLRKIDKKYFNNFYIDKYLDVDTYEFNINNKKIFNIIYSDEVKIKKVCRYYKEIFDINIQQLELYISQRRDWPYLSPMRIIRSIENTSIPVNIGNYIDSNYGKLCLNVNSIDDLIENYDNHRKNFIQELPLNINQFNKISDKFFHDFYSQLIDR